MSDAPKRIYATADRDGSRWAMVAPDKWFGEGFTRVEYIRADLARRTPWLPDELVERLREREKMDALVLDSRYHFDVTLLRDILAALADPRTPEQQKADREYRDRFFREE